MGDQNMYNQNHYDDHQHFGDTTTHTFQGPYNDYSVTDNSSGDTFQTNHGSGPFFAEPQRGYYAAPHRQAQRARGRGQPDQGPTRGRTPAPHAPHMRAQRARGRGQPNQGSTRGRTPAPQYGGYDVEPAYANRSYDDASGSYPAEPNGGYPTQDAWGDQTPAATQQKNENSAACLPPEPRYPITKPFANHYSERSESVPSAPPMNHDYAGPSGSCPPYLHRMTEPAPEDIRHADWQQQPNRHCDNLAAVHSEAQVNASTSQPTKRVKAKGNGWLALRTVLKNLAECSDGYALLKATLDEQVNMMGYCEVEGDQTQLFTLSGRATVVCQTLCSSEKTERIVMSLRSEELNSTTDVLKSIQRSIQSTKSSLVRGDRIALASREGQHIVQTLEDLVALLEDLHDEDTTPDGSSADDVDEPRRSQTEASFSLQGVSTIIDSTFNNIKGKNLYNAPVYNTRETNEQFRKLNHVAAAGIEAVAEEGCMEGTRVELLQSLRDWSDDPDAPRIFWLVGPAGAGKSAIARSLARLLLKVKLLGGSFFCSRQSSVRSNARNIIPTLAQFMARLYPKYSAALAEVLGPSSTDDVASWTIDRQTDKLLNTPLQKAYHDRALTQHHVDESKLVLVVDALDECADSHEISTFLTQLLSIPTWLPIKFFIASRPERDIRAHFVSQRSPDDQHRILRLHEVEHEIVERDISLFLRRRLKAIRVSTGISGAWPTNRDVAKLADLSGTLFIYASTVVKFIQDENPVKRLRYILRSFPEIERPLNGNLDQMYTLVLSDAMNPDIRMKEDISTTRRILAVILAAREPLSLAIMSALLGISYGAIRSSLERIHAVVHVPALDVDGAISIYHKSFADYLVSRERAPPTTFICLDAGHSELAKGCLSIMRRELRFNISGCKSSYLPTAMQELHPVAKDLRYSCLYWSPHIIGASHCHTPALLQSLEAILQTQFLFWLEILCTEDESSQASSLLLKLLSSECAQMSTATNLRMALHDGNQFVVAFRDIIGQSVPHIYLSALPSHPALSWIAQKYWPHFCHLPQLSAQGISAHNRTIFVINTPVTCVALSPNGGHIVSASEEDETIRVWDAASGELAMPPLTGHTNRITSVALSPDGSRIVSASFDQTIRVWDATSGELAMPPLTRHTDYITDVAFSPDGSRIMSASYDRTIRVWDATSGELAMPPLTGHTDSITSIAFSPDGTRIVSASLDETIRVWDAASGELAMPPLTGHTDSITSIAFSPDGTRIVSASLDETIRVWDATSGELAMPPLTGHTDSITSIAFSPDGTRIVSASLDETIRVWDATSGELAMPPLTGHRDYITDVAFSPDGSRIVSASHDETIRVWDASRGELAMPRFTGHKHHVTFVAFSPDGTRIISASYDMTIRVWDAAGGELFMPPLTGHTGSITYVAFSPDGSRIISASDDKTIRVWDATSGELAMPPLIGHTHCITSVAFSPDGSRIVSASDDKTIRVWDAASGELAMPPLTGHTDSITSIAFSPDGTRIVSASLDETIRVWDATSGELAMPPLTGHTDSITSIAFSPDGTRIVSASLDETIRVWDATSGELAMPPLTGHRDYITDVAFSPDGSRIVSASHDETIRVWDASRGELAMPRFTGHKHHVTFVAFSPDGTRIISASYDMTIRVWDAAGGELFMPPLTGHTGSITYVAFSPDGSRIISASDDKTIRVWDATSGELAMPPLIGHTHCITSVAFSPDGSRIVSASDDKTIRVWDATSGELAMPPLTGHTDRITSVAFSPDGSCILSASHDKTIRVWDAASDELTDGLTGHTGDDMYSSSDNSNVCLLDVSHSASSFAQHAHTWTVAPYSPFIANPIPDEDGWIRGSNDELLLWISPEYRQFVIFKPSRCILLIAKSRVVIDVSRFLHGKDWIHCHQ
ncbi:hypothetical protein HGRIS_001123 [Hohenbuehelia grisea]|uniref:Nephrocystin 3-like N-terminal domain-containing protein n=1 Tax=Hohenbuehelia grisea TaxID=104357 RepID=A0ABR3JNC2_9AGAR